MRVSNDKIDMDKENGKRRCVVDFKLNGNKRIPGPKSSETPTIKKPRKQAVKAASEPIVGSGRQAAQNLNFQEKSVRMHSKNDRLAIKEEARCDSELSALVDTDAGMPSVKVRRLGDFTITNANDQMEPIENVSFGDKGVFISGMIYPREGPVTKDTGRRLEKFGPLRSFSVDLNGKTASITLHTDMASYVAMKPSSLYKRILENLSGQADVLFEVFCALSPSKGGSINATFEEVIAHLARSKAVRGYSTPREGLLVNGKFIMAQLKHLDQSRPSHSMPLYSETPFAKSLSEALSSFKYVGSQALQAQQGGISIKDSRSRRSSDRGVSEADAQMAADEDLARRLQAKMDAQALTRRNSAGTKNPQAYIKVSEAEIADDYPPPASYIKEEEETDELILADEDMMNVDPEYLPRRLLTDFSIYNAEGLLATLELLPMSAGIDPDVELFASGVVVEDEGDFSGAQTLGTTNQPSNPTGEKDQIEEEEGGSSAAGGSAASSKENAPQDAGMRMYLSQIREWVVEFGADMLFITIRTDVAWYRLATPSTRYQPWFETVLRCSRLAAKIIGMIAGESRASKLSYSDVVRRLLKEPEDSPTYISKRIQTVEKYLAVHGQIVLSCFQHYPIESIRRSAFVTHLKEKLALVRHSKLYHSGSRSSKLRTVNRNPMKDRAAGARSKPMTATATTMVKSIWQAYFTTFGHGAAADGLASSEKAGTANAVSSSTAVELIPPLAQEVEDDENDDDNENDVSENALAGSGKDVSARRRATRCSASKASNKKDDDHSEPQVIERLETERTIRDARKKQAYEEETIKKVSWVGPSLDSLKKDKKMYSKAKVGGMEIALGSAVELWELLSESDEEDVVDSATKAKGGSKSETNDGHNDDDQEQEQETFEPFIGLVQALWQDEDGEKWAQARELVRGKDTVLGDAASECELFLTKNWQTFPLHQIGNVCALNRLLRPWDTSCRIEFFKQDAELRAKNEILARDGRPLELFWRRQYVPEDGMFCDAPEDLQLGKIIPEATDPDTSVYALEDSSGFVKDGVTYRVGDFMFIAPEVFDQMPEAVQEIELPDYLAQSRYHKGSYEGLRAWGVCRLAKVSVSSVSKRTQSAASAGKGGERNKRIESITVTRYWRPEDISTECGYKASTFFDVYASNEKVEIDVEDVIRPLQVVSAERSEKPSLSIDMFQCVGSFNRKTKSFGPVPDYLRASSSQEDNESTKGKGKAQKSNGCDVCNRSGKEKIEGWGLKKRSDAQVPGDDGIALATMDIFAGCGGLTEGMHQAGAAFTRWAIEYEVPAADAFKENYPYAHMFCNNCNVLLHAAMLKSGMENDCLASDEAKQESRALPPEEVQALPLPGEVDFICGGPPCQGYSGMNRFNKGNWSMVQNSMVMSFLSYADFYRPRYFLLENVRNFVSHNKSFTFRLTLRTLLDMGYQVRFGVLNAGNFGVSQSRKRTFIWAAAPGERLPNWPRLMHCFRTPQLCINLPGGIQYTAVPQTVGAPLRPVTVQDAIGDLPEIQNGADENDLPYAGAPHSAFQRAVRGNCTRLMDHISKQMNELNLERCRCIPKNCPGADWRVLEEIVRQDPSREKFKGQPLVPWCLPNTADRHNGWRGLFGRLDWRGHFPTSTTDPQPMGKVGQVFHPEQDRIVSVRECARAQGFPDHHRFYGNVNNKHRQVGNAVPPPLAAALGKELRTALEYTASREAAALLQAQM